MLAAVATAHQRARTAELAQLAVMGRLDLREPWSDATRSTVLLARQRIHEARSARADFRGQIREFVVTLRDAGEPASSALRYTRSMMRLLESTGAIEADGGQTEAEVLGWAIEDYESP
jgi:hypothetical protein